MFFCLLLILFSVFFSSLRGSFHNYCRRANFWSDGNSVTSKDGPNWQATQNQMFKCHFLARANLKLNIACKAIKRLLQAIDGCRESFLSCIGLVLGLHVVFCALFPRPMQRAVVARGLGKRGMVSTEFYFFEGRARSIMPMSSRLSSAVGKV